MRPRETSAFEVPLPAPRRPRYACLDMWRGVACLTIVVYHAALAMVRRQEKLDPSGDPVASALAAALGFGWLAVPWFFVISGYCITATVDSSRQKSRAPLDYFKRRFRRIFPPYWVVLGVTLAAVWAAAGAGFPWLLANQDGVPVKPSGFTRWQWVGNVSLTETWRPYVVGEQGGLLVGQAWSLCYEEQFYAVAGLILFAMPARIFTGFALVTAFSGVLMVLRALRWVPSQDGWFFDGNWLLFATGVAVYYAVNHGTKPQRVVLALALGAGAVVTALPPCQAVMKALAPAVLAGFSFGLVLLLLHPHDERMARWGPLRPLFFCGEMCYSVYLVHILVAFPAANAFAAAGLGGFWPTVTLTVPLATALSVGLARLFHLGVERHFLNNRPRVVRPAREAELALEAT